jgi:hypothetical protein
MVCIDNFWFSCYISNMLDKLKTIFNKKQKLEKTAKDIATEAGEPYIKVLDTNVDPENPKYGYFELDWNQHFVNNLKEHGFSGNTDEEVVDHWFSVLCNTIADEATPLSADNQIVKETKREDGKTEIS